MSNEIREIYVGHNELVSYLRDHRNKSKSFHRFLFFYRERIVESSLFFSATSWQEYDNAWPARFLKVAKEIKQINFGTLKDKDYWKEVILECKTRRAVINYQSEKERYLRIISDLDEKIQMERANLAELTSKWYKRKDVDKEPDLRINPNEGDFEDFGTDFDHSEGNNNESSAGSTSYSSRKRRDMDEEPDFRINPIEGNFEDFGDGFDLGGIYNERDNDSSANSISRQRSVRSVTPSPPTHNYNLRVGEPINYNVGSSSKRRRHRTNPSIRRVTSPRITPSQRSSTPPSPLRIPPLPSSPLSSPFISDFFGEEQPKKRICLSCPIHCFEQESV
ncbi:7155_t:CDS:2 [Funneliformis caledonium]|uniref:7155_t:CDS:1 n=1 Tax=Funneliformis caledonium TaxID=1117310 RepID=A0A9N9DFR9_9GLOM|nr:7155_t:CDS:2 [Funneliformis caledonium]